jgi:ABC-type lipoprotein export system ATPase subunit
MTIVLATHDQELAGKADRMLVLRGGKLERVTERTKTVPWVAAAASRA